MKRGIVLLSFVFVMFLFSFNTIFAKECDLQVSMINQDPYPAIQEEYVKIVFQVDGVENPDCGRVEFELVEKYPISLDPTEESLVVVDAGTYTKDFSSFLIVPYKVRVDADALDGDNPIEVKYRYSGNEAYQTKQFDLNIKDTRADFEVHVEDYDPVTKMITFEILNVGEYDIEALTVEILKQDNIEIKGSNQNIVGDLDSNEYVTADFEATPSKGIINVKLTYTDTINVRRSVEEIVLYEPEYFEGRISDKDNSSSTKYIVIGVIAVAVLFYFYRRNKKKKAKERRR